MRKTLLCLAVALAACPALSASKAAARAAAKTPPTRWSLVVSDEFAGSALDARFWTRIPAGSSDWNRHMTTNPACSFVKGGNLILRGVVNPGGGPDARPFLTGGVMTHGRLVMKYGKVEIRARLGAAKGAWPAIWMLPESPKQGWPQCGEIDIIERLNHDSFVYQTVHSGWAEAHPNDPPKGGRGAIRPDDYNVYGLEWQPDLLVWTVNGKETFRYARREGVAGQWPFDEPCYLMIDMQLGGSWVGAVDKSALPVEMAVDWVRFYVGCRGAERFGEVRRPNPSAAGRVL